MANRNKKRASGKVDYNPLVMRSMDYGMSDLNWKDSGGTYNEPKEVEDPSMNDFIKGYNMDSGRYEFKQWAKTHKDNKKYAAQEVVDISYTPEALAKRILTLWRNNGELQSFFDGFTSNQKMTNQMKKKIADILCAEGYEVVPTLIDEKPRYANRESAELLTLIKEAKDSLSKQDMLNVANILKKIFPQSIILEKVSTDIKLLKKHCGNVADKDSTMGLLDYYNKIFPMDYSRSLVDKIFNKPKKHFDEFQDFELSDKMVEQRQKFNKGEQDFMSRGPKDGGMGGYNFPADMRGDGPGGVAPNMLETGPRMAARLLKKKRS